MRRQRAALPAAKVALAVLCIVTCQRRQHVDGVPSTFDKGVKVGERIPNFSLADQNGEEQSLASLAKKSGLIMVFHRSASW